MFLFRFFMASIWRQYSLFTFRMLYDIDDTNGLCIFVECAFLLSLVLTNWKSSRHLWSPSNPTVKTSWKKTVVTVKILRQGIESCSNGAQHGQIARGSVMGDRQPPHQHIRDVWCTSEWSRLFHHPPCCQWRRIHSEFSKCHFKWKLPLRRASLAWDAELS